MLVGTLAFPVGHFVDSDMPSLTGTIQKDFDSKT
jgi:hypothetical protein